MMAKKKNNLLNIKDRTIKMLIQLAFYYVKLLNNGFPRIDVENICDVHL
jgi:hypothetical protein